MIFSSLLFILVLIPVSFTNAEETTTKEKVLLYVFYGENCEWCEELHEYLDELSLDNEYNYMYKLVDLEVWNDADNNNLMANVADYFDYSLKGVPYIVCGDSFITGFNSEKTACGVQLRCPGQAGDYGVCHSHQSQLLQEL